MALIQANFISKALMRTVPINVILPVDKMTFPGMPVREDKPYKTLYLLHGVFGNYTDWVSGTNIQRWAEEKDCLLEVNRDFRDYLKGLGIEVTFEEGPGAHEWDFWNTYIRRVLEWLPLEKNEAGINSGNIGI